MRILFIAAGPISWGSSRIRAYWPAEHIEGADVVQKGEFDLLPLDYDVYIFQKYGNPDAQHELRARGKQVWLDECDPMWWFSPDEMVETVRHCDGVVASSQNLGSDFNEWAAMNADGMLSHLIHDRLSMDHYDRTREHGEADPVRIIWYGVAVNRVSIIGAWANLARLAANGYNIELTVMDDRPDSRFSPGNEVPIYQVPFDLEHEVEILTAHDIALLPPYPGPWGKVKSANKKRTAGACGLPWTDGHDYWELLELVASPELRAESGAAARRDVEQFWNVERSAREWERLLDV